ncbi:MAG: biotin--[acetyl-CoA-carboxylase] ligase [bacterium]|nr:biotin--[acetyl-CoA-carboxylase] ligase [bacterium]
MDPDREDVIVGELLGAPAYVSGEEIARRLRISRTAVWNRVNALRRLGFQVESHPHLGYRLVRAPDALLPALVSHGLVAEIVGRRILHFEELRSTNDEAERLARAGAPEGTVVVAERQSAGRGRMGRAWVSPPRKGIYLSVILRPAMPPSRTAFLTLCAAVAAADAVRRCAGLRASVKWPNDVRLGGRKVCGILTELATEADRINHAVVGVGVNVNHDPADLRGLEATSLKIESGGEVERVGLARALLEELDGGYAALCAGRYGDIVRRWLEVSDTIGRRIRAESLTGERLEGVATGLDEDGCLLIRLEGGATKRITGGDVRII